MARLGGFENLTPVGGAVAAALDLLENNSKSAAFEIFGRDDRFSEERWAQVFRNELLQYQRWILKKLYTQSVGQQNIVQPAFPSLLCLLPGYGAAIHLLRRAAPFAALGIEVICSFPENGPEARRIIDIASSSLGLGRLRLSESSSDAEIVAFGKGIGWVVLTGREATYQHIRLKYREANLFGATGRCAVIVGKVSRTLQYAGTRFQLMQSSKSCRRLGALVSSGDLAEDAIASINDGASAYNERGLGDILRSLHPSVVLCVAGDYPSVPDFIAGYRAVELGLDGMANLVTGFGADPIAGWPGDYMI